MNKSKEYWQKQTSSDHRFGDDEFYQLKAREHASLMMDEHRSIGCIDIGCGAGELLRYLSEEVKVDVGLDYSDSMLNMAKKQLAGRNIELLNAELFDFLPDQKQKVWITCGAINQYLNKEKQVEFLDLFSNHHYAEALYLFDCVDPIRYSLLRFGIGYTPDSAVSDGSAIRALLRALRRKQLRFTIGIGLALGLRSEACQKLGGSRMGHGFLPKFWIVECEKRDLALQLVSSRFYEYRYHAIINKKKSSKN